MSHLKSLTFVQAPPKQSSDPLLVRRRRLIEQLQDQQQLARDPAYSPLIKRWQKAEDGSRKLVDRYRRIRPWWRKDDNGFVVLVIRSGLKTLEFEKGKPGIAVGSQDRLEAVLETLIAAVRAGELDPLLKADESDTEARPAPKLKKAG